MVSAAMAQYDLHMSTKHGVLPSVAPSPPSVLMCKSYCTNPNPNPNPNPSPNPNQFLAPSPPGPPVTALKAGDAAAPKGALPSTPVWGAPPSTPLAAPERTLVIYQQQLPSGECAPLGFVKISRAKSLAVI